MGHITIRNIINGTTWKWLKLNFNRVEFKRDTIYVPKLLYEELLRVGVDNTVLNSRVKILESV